MKRLTALLHADPKEFSADLDRASKRLDRLGEHISQLRTSLLRRLRAARPSATDIHLYGGAGLVSAGCGLRWGWWAALVALGAALIGVGVWIRLRYGVRR